MGNSSNTELWATQERLRFIERSAFWRGVVNRSDIQEVFGVSAAQSSADLQRYQELNPGALSYNLRKKRYEGTAGMSCLLQTPRLEEALGTFLQPGALPYRPTAELIPAADGRVTMVTLPSRAASVPVQRAIFFATLHGFRVQVDYASLTGSKNAKRWIAPHAFAHDGYRWHVRAWCETNASYRDFVLSRIRDTEWPSEAALVSGKDLEWETKVQLVISPSKLLSPEQQEVVKADFGMKAGRATLTVRKAMLNYTLAHLRLPAVDEKSLPPWLEVVRLEES
ncbi:WYL domain-containing protein [soil metagenome]